MKFSLDIRRTRTVPTQTAQYDNTLVKGCFKFANICTAFCCCSKLELVHLSIRFSRIIITASIAKFTPTANEKSLFSPCQIWLIPILIVNFRITPYLRDAYFKFFYSLFKVFLVLCLLTPSLSNFRFLMIKNGPFSRYFRYKF